MSHPTPDTDQITLIFSTHTIQQLRLLAFVRGESPDDVAESLLYDGGLLEAVLHDLIASNAIPQGWDPVDVGDWEESPGEEPTIADGQ